MKDINLFRTKDSIYLKKIKTKADISGRCDGYLIEGGEKEARKIIASLKDSARNSVLSKLGTNVPSLSSKVKVKVGIVGGDDAFNRRAIETLKIDYLVSPEGERPEVAGISGFRDFGVSRKTDTLKQRDSGINHVVAKMAAEKGVVIVIDLSEISKLSGKDKALRLGRIIQNVKVCRKVGCGIKIASLASGKGGLVDEKGRIAIGVSFGMNSRQSADAVSF